MLTDDAPPTPGQSAEVDPEFFELERLLVADEYMLCGSWTLGLSDNSVHWSPENHAIYGTDPATFVPTLPAIHRLIDPRDRARMAAMAAAWRADTKPFNMLARITCPSGEMRVIEIRGWVQQDGAGLAIGAHGTTTDVTEVVAERRSREAVSEQRDVILRAAGDGICGLDRQGQVTFSNPAMVELLGRPAQEVDGLRLHDLVHRDAAGTEAHDLAQCPYFQPDDALIPVIDSAFRRADGSLLHVSCIRVAVDNERFGGSVISVRDVTERIETLRRIERLSAERAELLRSLVAAEENERSRIAADLHDDTVQTLSALSLRLERATAAAQDADSRLLLAGVEDNVRAATTRMRFLLFELLPPVTERDLRTAITAYCELLFLDAGVDYEVSGDPTDIPIDTYLLAYRLIQGALRNVRKHAQASMVHVVLESDGVELVARVCDDGVGFGADTSALTGSVVGGMARRAQAAGGSLERSPPSSCTGASITLRLPLRLR